MRLTVVGCSGSYPGPASSASCYLVEADHEGRTWRLLLDLGNGALGSLQRHADPLTVDAVLLSHLHADHCLDMCGYYVMRKYHPTGPQPRIPVYGPDGTAARLARAYDLPEDPGMTEEFDFEVFPSGSFVLGPFTVTASPVAHPVPAYALRVEAGGRVLTYSGDTGPCGALEKAARGAHVFLCEASFREVDDNPPDLHLTGAEAGAAATRAGAGSLLLTHVPPWHDDAEILAEARPAFDGPLELVRCGHTYDV
ncbi:MBL fold metallo-hydrolase [Nocardioidaceae bacterium]|nr:MBL fold metallo-hydrolase [Nocardioidaceae bacterium]